MSLSIVLSRKAITLFLGIFASLMWTVEPRIALMSIIDMTIEVLLRAESCVAFHRLRAFIWSIMLLLDMAIE